MHTQDTYPIEVGANYSDIDVSEIGNTIKVPNVVDSICALRIQTQGNEGCNNICLKKLSLGYNLEDCQITNISCNEAGKALETLNDSYVFEQIRMGNFTTIEE
jgi:hypothetical protein